MSYIMPQGGEIYKSSEIPINRGDAIHQIKSGITTNITMDSFRKAVIDGNAFTIGFSDPTGMNAGVSYYYIIKNASTTKSAWIRPIEFHSADATAGNVGGYLKALQMLIIKDGLFSLDGGATTINPNDFTTSAYDAFKIPAINLNGGSENTSEMGLWFLTGIATAASKTVSWEDSATDQILKRIASDTFEPKQNVNDFRIVPPGAIFVGILTNFSEKKAGYAVDVEWAEV